MLSTLVYGKTGTDIERGNMKLKYIRTKDGEIIEFNYEVLSVFAKKLGMTFEEYIEDLFKITTDNIVKQADTIEELIMQGDLVMVGLTILIVRETMKDELVGHDMGLIRKNAVEVLWIRQGKDFVKCAVKKEGDDYLTLCD